MVTVGSLIAAGRTSDVYDYGRGSVVKVPRPYVPAAWALMEARFTSAVADLGAPAPAVREVVQIDGRDAIVFERVAGRSMWELILDSPRNARSLGAELAEIHKVILRVGLPEHVLGLEERMCSKLAEVAQLDDAERAEAQQEVRELPRGAALLHGDLHPGNVLMSDEPVVIDWFDAAIGHPIADVVRSSLLVRPANGPVERPHLPGATAGVLSELHDGYVAAVSEEVSRPLDELRQWEALVAASRLAEDAEWDESSLLSLWRQRHHPGGSPLIDALSAVVDESPQ